MSQGKIEITCTSKLKSALFTVGKRYPVAYKGASKFEFRNDMCFVKTILLDDNGYGFVYDGAEIVASFKHLVTLKNESL